MTLQSKIGEKLKKARKELSLTQVEVAEKAGIHHNYYARIERDEVNPSLEVFKGIIKVLGVRSSEVLDF